MADQRQGDAHRFEEHDYERTEPLPPTAARQGERGPQVTAVLVLGTSGAIVVLAALLVYYLMR